MNISAILIKNKTLVSIKIGVMNYQEHLSLIDNDLGPDAGECIGISLGMNTTLKSLKISENAMKSEGAIAIIKNAGKLQTLFIAKYFQQLLILKQKPNKK